MRPRRCLVSKQTTHVVLAPFNLIVEIHPNRPARPCVAILLFCRQPRTIRVATWLFGSPCFHPSQQASIRVYLIPSETADQGPPGGRRCATHRDQVPEVLAVDTLFLRRPCIPDRVLWSGFSVALPNLLPFTLPPPLLGLRILHSPHASAPAPPPPPPPQRSSSLSA
jgi:hypothetical protein